MEENEIAWQAWHTLNGFQHPQVHGGVLLSDAIAYAKEVMNLRDLEDFVLKIRVIGLIWQNYINEKNNDAGN